MNTKGLNRGDEVYQVYCGKLKTATIVVIYDNYKTDSTIDGKTIPLSIVHFSPTVQEAWQKHIDNLEDDLEALKESLSDIEQDIRGINEQIDEARQARFSA